MLSTNEKAAAHCAPRPNLKAYGISLPGGRQAVHEHSLQMRSGLFLAWHTSFETKAILPYRRTASRALDQARAGKVESVDPIAGGR
jgi:hypothetical protein